MHLTLQACLDLDNMEFTVFKVIIITAGLIVFAAHEAEQVTHALRRLLRTIKRRRTISRRKRRT
jgi:hypothetical protein